MWITQQILKEMAGEPWVPDHEFFRWPDFIALRTAFGEKSDEEIWENGFSYSPTSRPKKVMGSNRWKISQIALIIKLNLAMVEY